MPSHNKSQGQDEVIVELQIRCSRQMLTMRVRPQMSKGFR